MSRSRAIRVSALRRHTGRGVPDTGSSAHTAAAESAGAEYRRKARRLRARFADRPGQLQRSLRELVDETNASSGRDGSQLTSGYLSTPGPAAIFAAMVGEAIEAGLVRYSQRQRLFKAAENLGISRFEANLIMATVQHRKGYSPAPESAGRRSWGPLVAMFLVIQLLIVGGLFLLMWV